jgi:hypothetical protein
VQRFSRLGTCLPLDLPILCMTRFLPRSRHRILSNKLVEEVAELGSAY